jgi:hypothetical protein
MVNEPPPRRERTATNSRVVLAVLVITFFAMLGAIYLVIRTGRL